MRCHLARRGIFRVVARAAARGAVSLSAGARAVSSASSPRERVFLGRACVMWRWLLDCFTGWPVPRTRPSRTVRRRARAAHDARVLHWHRHRSRSLERAAGRCGGSMVPGRASSEGCLRGQPRGCLTRLRALLAGADVAVLDAVVLRVGHDLDPHVRQGVQREVVDAGVAQDRCGSRTRVPGTGSAEPRTASPASNRNAAISPGRRSLRTRHPTGHDRAGRMRAGERVPSALAVAPPVPEHAIASGGFESASATRGGSASRRNDDATRPRGTRVTK